MIKGGGLFSSTKKLYYKNGKLYAEVFAYKALRHRVVQAGLQKPLD